MAAGRKKKIFLVIALLFALLLLAPWLIPARAYRGRVEASLGRALGRTVTLEDISVHLFPRPGLSLTNLVIGEDPAFGAEPMLWAPEVTADLRLASLLHRRIEFSTLTAKDASLNLVRRDDGVWSIRSLMQRADKPASGSSGGPPPEFPYLEATNSRVNFKYGLEKKPFALADADFSLWLDSGEWHARLRARPIRADANLSDMGTVRAEGVLTPRHGDPPAVRLQASWQDAQLGQSSALFFGHDRGWRGATEAQVTASGSLEALEFNAGFAVSGFHRYDIMPAEALRLATTCSGKFFAARGALTELSCKSKAGEGEIEVAGRIDDLWGERDYQLSMKLNAVPVERMAAFARNAKKDLPPDLTAEGLFSGELQLARNAGAAPEISGEGTASKLILRSAASDSTLPLESIAFVIRAPSAALPRDGSYVLAAAPFLVPLGETPVQASAMLDKQGYRILLNGAARLGRVQTVAALLGMRPPAYSLQGSAVLHLQIAGPWAGFAPPMITGDAQLRDVATDALGSTAPLRLASAHLILRPDAVRVENLAAQLGATGPRFAGLITLPRGCAHPEDCEVSFALRSAELDLDELNAALQPAPAHRAWYQFGSSTAPPAALRRVRASGQLVCRRATLKALKMNDVAANVTLDAGQVRISDARARLLGGRYRGEWRIDFTATAPQYASEGALEGVNMAQLSELMGDDWAAGVAAARYQLHFAGRSREEMIASAAGSASFDWSNGALKHVTLQPAPHGLRFAYFRGEAKFQDQNVTFVESRLATAYGIYQVSGRASMDRTLEVGLARGKDRVVYIHGTLAAPKVSEVLAITEVHPEASTVAR